jgi:hypothetical protein
VPVGGALTPSEESREVAWIAPERLADLDIHPTMRLRIEHALGERAVPYIG